MSNDKTTGHTPGPWYPVEYAGYFDIQDAPHYGADDLLDADKVGYETAKANAELIAQAPTLKAQRDELVKTLEEIAAANIGWHIGDAIEVAKSALTKVKE